MRSLMTGGLTSGQIIRLRSCLQRGIAFDNPLAEAAASSASAALAAEIAARIAADSSLLVLITALEQPTYAREMLLGGM